ncbi:lipid A biosynthesis acyltransferase [Ectothiorhodosinus mongolicus]|nr:lipid A biosynthesis acyltransferase [Ectothiorhodosinus mongolicus]
MHPKHWPLWIAAGIFRPLTRVLPWRSQISIGRAIGATIYYLAPHRRRIALTNLQLCFPEKTDTEHTQLAKKHFKAMGPAIFETMLSWWGADKQLLSLAHFQGLDHLIDAKNRGKGVLLVSAHFAPLEITGRLLAMQVPFAFMYRRERSALLEHFFATYRVKHYRKAIRSDDIREAIKLLKGGEIVWYTPDQAYQGPRHLNVPFFNVPAATNSATARIAKATGAAVIPFFGYRLSDQEGYRLEILPALQGFPGGNLEADTARINRIIEEAVRKHPEQYFWTHRRFRYPPESGLTTPY